MTKRRMSLVGAGVAIMLANSNPVWAADKSVNIAFIDPLSGAFAAQGENSLKNMQYIAELANQEQWAGQYKVNVVGFDNKGTVQESLQALRAAMDQGFRYITTGGSSGATLAMLDAINKHNERNPGKEVLLLNYSSVDPDMTNSKCNFWHFRYDAHIDMKSKAMVAHLVKDKNIKKVYLIGQNYVSGVSFNKSAKEQLQKQRPDIQIVGEDLHPIGQVKDFSPYIAKMKTAGADAVITGNWGPDLSLLIKAAKDADLKVNFYTYYANLKGTPTAIGAAGENRVKYGTVWLPTPDNAVGNKIIDGYRKKYGDEFVMPTTYSAISSFSKALKDSNSSEPADVAFALEGMTIKGLSGEQTIRKDDHQLLQPFYIATWTKVNGKDVKFDVENTSFNWKPNEIISTADASLPTTCDMKRPNRK